MANYRMQRVNSEVQKAVMEIINSSVKDPRLTDMVSVTRADVDQDLKNAKIYLSIYSNDPARKQGNFDAIKGSAGFIRHELAKILPHIRQVPVLNFYIDESLDYSDKINKILLDIKKNEEGK